MLVLMVDSLQSDYVGHCILSDVYGMYTMSWELDIPLSACDWL